MPDSTHSDSPEPSDRPAGNPAPTVTEVPEMPKPQITERRALGMPGLPFLVIALVVLVGGIVLLAVGGTMAGQQVTAVSTTLNVAGALVIVADLIMLRGLTQVAPGQARVCQLFGRYQGTIRQDGLRWVNPFTSRRKISTRLRNHQTEVLKVNDAYGNPIEISCVVVWQVSDTAQAVFEVDSFVDFVSIQTETAVRHIATHYAYDAHGADELSLRENAEVITEQLSAEIAARVESAGVTIVESRFTHLAYAPEIASAMLQRQQAGAIVAARATIVDGAVGMVESALNRIAEQGLVELDEERKATMVSNLLVVLCGDRAAQPVLNTGTLYQ